MGLPVSSFHKSDSLDLLMYTVKVQGNISVLPTPPLNPESLLEGPFSTFAEFEKNLHEFEKATYAVFRKNNTVSVQTARKYLKHNMPDDIVYHRAQFVCTHFGKPRYRGKGVINHSTTLATGCEAELVLLWNNHVRKLVVTKKNLMHNHDVNAFTYSQQYKVKRLTNEQKEEIKELIKKNIKIKGDKLRDVINSKYNKCFSLRDASLLKHQLKKAMTPEEKETLHNASKLTISLDEAQRDISKESALEQDTKDTSIQSPKSPYTKSKVKKSQDPPVLPDPTSTTDMSQFVSYLDASNRMKRRSEDSQVINLLQSSFMIRKPNILSVKKRRTEEIQSDTNPTKDATVMTITKEESLEEEKDVRLVERLDVDKDIQIIVCKNASDADTRHDASVSQSVSDIPRSAHSDRVANDGEDKNSISDSRDHTTHSLAEMQTSRNFHFFMDLCRQVDALNHKAALEARQELSRVVHKYMMANVDANYASL